MLYFVVGIMDEHVGKVLRKVKSGCKKLGMVAINTCKVGNNSKIELLYIILFLNKNEIR